jgi:Cof subfamily protein (haloacid dehalogenase superfamily)
LPTARRGETVGAPPLRGTDVAQPAYRLLALDLDGTVVDAQLRVDERDVAALGDALRAGIHVIASTGRPFPGALPWVQRLGLTDPIVCYQGAEVRTLDGEMLLDHGVPRDLAADLIRFCRERDLHVQAYRDDRLLIEKDRPEAHQYANHAGMQINLVPDLIEALGPTTPKLVIVAARDVVEELLVECRRRYEGRLVVATSMPTYLEFTNPDADKRQALEFLARRFGITPDQVVAVGDGRNDASMLAWAGLGVAVEGAAPEVLEAADRTIPRPGSGGIAMLVRELLGW